MTTRRTTRQSPAPPPPPAAAGAPSPEERFAAHARTGARGLGWHRELGRLALACCPPRTPGRRRRLGELAGGHLRCSATLLYKAMKFATQHTAPQVSGLERAGVGWDVMAQLLPLAPRDRPAAARRAARRGLTSREIRRWRVEEFGPRPPRGGRPAAPLPDLGPAEQARALAADCRRLVAVHANTAGVFERHFRDIDAGHPPAPAVREQVEAAATAVGRVLGDLGTVRDLLDRLARAAADRSR